MWKIDAFPHGGKGLTGKLMYHFADAYCEDLGLNRHARLPAFFADVRRIPYRSDDELFPSDANDVTEIVARPKYLLDRRLWPALDCKKKAILMGAWAACNGIPYAFVAVAEYPEKSIHHVFPLLFVDGEWITADATLPENYLGQSFPLTKAEELTR